MGPRGPRARERGLSEGPRGRVAKSVGAPGGPILGPGPLTNHQHRLEKRVFERNRVFRVGPTVDAENSKTDSRSDGLLGGSEMKGHGPKGPPEALSGRPKGPTPIGGMGFGKRQPQNVGFPLGNTTFSKNRQSAPGGPPGAFFQGSRKPPEGPGTPRGIFDVFRGGPRTPSGLRREIPGGPRGAKGAPFLVPGGRFVTLGGPGNVKKQLVFIVKSTPGGPRWIARKCTKGVERSMGNRSKPRGGQNGSWGGPGGPGGRPGGPKGGPEGELGRQGAGPGNHGTL